MRRQIVLLGVLVFACSSPSALQAQTAYGQYWGALRMPRARSLPMRM